MQKSRGILLLIFYGTRPNSLVVRHGSEDGTNSPIQYDCSANFIKFASNLQLQLLLNSVNRSTYFFWIASDHLQNFRRFFFSLNNVSGDLHLSAIIPINII